MCGRFHENQGNKSGYNGLDQFVSDTFLPEDDKVMKIITIQPLGTMKTKQNCRDSFSKDQDYDYFIRNDHVVGVMLREEFAVQEKY